MYVQKMDFLYLILTRPKLTVQQSCGSGQIGTRFVIICNLYTVFVELVA
jgi:hypothetical protein